MKGGSEYLPEPRLATHIESFWTMNAPRPLESPVVQTSASKSSLDLAAQPLGVGTCWAGFIFVGTGASPDLHAALGLPER